jgi:hypothetical protein
MTMDSSDWKGAFRKHWRAHVLIAIGAVLAFADAIYVFLWYVSNAQSSGMVPSTLGLWTMANLVTFIVYGILWGLLLVGVPVAVAGVLGWRWWKRLPAEERIRFKMSGRKRSTGGGGGSLLFFILFCIKVWVDGKWNTPIAGYTLDYVVGSVVTILVLVVIIVGIPAAIALTWWITRGTKKPLA